MEKANNIEIPTIKPISEIDTSAITTAFLNHLGQPTTKAQEIARAAFDAGKADVVRVIAAVNLDDPYCKALGYMVSIPKKPPTLAVLLAESARSIADYQETNGKQRNLIIAELQTIIANAFGLKI